MLGVCRMSSETGPLVHSESVPKNDSCTFLDTYLVWWRWSPGSAICAVAHQSSQQRVFGLVATLTPHALASITHRVLMLDHVDWTMDMYKTSFSLCGCGYCQKQKTTMDKHTTYRLPYLASDTVYLTYYIDGPIYFLGSSHRYRYASCSRCYA